MAKKVRQLQREIAAVKRDLMELDTLRPGSLSERYTQCGNPNCRCAGDPPERHGPYYHLSFTRKGRGGTKFVRKEDIAAVKKQLRNYKRLQALVDRWVDLSTELSIAQLAPK